MHLNKIGQPSLLAAIAVLNTVGAGRNKTGCETPSLLSNNGCWFCRLGLFTRSHLPNLPDLICDSADSCTGRKVATVREWPWHGAGAY